MQTPCDQRSNIWEKINISNRNGQKNKRKRKKKAKKKKKKMVIVESLMKNRCVERFNELKRNVCVKDECAYALMVSGALK